MLGQGGSGQLGYGNTQQISRRETCSLLADRHFGACGSGGNKYYSNKEEYLELCMTVGAGEGASDEFFGYDPKTGEDTCAEELHAQAQCFADLSDEEYCALEELPYLERECTDEISIESDCRKDHLKEQAGS